MLKKQKNERIRNKINIIIILFSVYFLIDCSANKQKINLFNRVTYKSEFSSKYLEFKGTEFILSDSTTMGHQGFYTENCRVLSFGNYAVNGNYLEINTSEDILYNIVNSKITSKNTKSDSVTFFIKTGLSKNLGDRISYQLFLDYDGEYDFQKEFSNSFNSNIIKLPKPFFGVKIKNISISIIYENNSKRGFEYVTTLKEETNDSDDYYVIEIPELDICYFEYVRYEGEYIKILDNHTLLWDNEKYYKVDY